MGLRPNLSRRDEPGASKLATENSDERFIQDEPCLHEEVAFDREDGFIDYLARRLGVESREARERLSAWLSAYEPPRRSGVRRAVPVEDEAEEIARSA
jgi:hypothetical protein